MNKNLSKLYTILIVTLVLVFLTACHTSSNETQEEIDVVLSTSEDILELDEESIEQNALSTETHKEFDSVVSSSEDTTELVDSESIEQNVSKELIEEETSLGFDIPDDSTFLIESWGYNGTQQSITLTEDGFLQYWLNQTMICEKQIPLPAELHVGNGFYEIIGNPYISKDGSLVLIQSYTTLEDEKILDYTILANNCSKIISSLAYDGYVFQDHNGNYGFAFYCDNSSGYLNVPWYPYEGVKFNTIDANCALPQPTLIWLDESTVRSIKFGYWGSTSYGYQDIYAISVRLYVASYGELDISCVCGPFEPVEVDDDFFRLFSEKFAPQEYEERFSKLIKTINEYRLK